VAVVDWRNRFNANWISSVRSQGSAPNCWAFAMTALYEAMVRIEHSVWCHRSEGDLGRTTGKQPWDLGNPGEPAIAAERFGVADPDCMPWSEATVLYTAKPHGAAMTAMPLSPTPDRAGRTVRIDPNAHTVIDAGNVIDKKRWLNRVGPMAFMCTLPADFTGSPASGIYSRATTANGGVHAMLVVGFDDFNSCWIIKNSWGQGFGTNGFLRVAYGQSWLEGTQWWGVRNTNPDPWTKRRQRNGVVIETGNGAAHQNREVFLRVGMGIDHFWTEGGAGWNNAGTVQSPDDSRGINLDALDCPATVQSTFNRNYELIYRSSYGRLTHNYFDQASGWWFNGMGPPNLRFGPMDPRGIPGFVQGNRGAPGDFEVVVLTASGAVEHWSKHNSSPWKNPPGTWYPRATVTTKGTAGGPALVSSRLNLTGELELNAGELHYVCASGNSLLHFRLTTPSGSWTQVDAFGTGTSPYSGPCMIETLDESGNELSAGPLQLFVETGGQIEHWYRPAPSRWRPSTTWNRVTVFGADVKRVIGALQGSSSLLEVYVERTDGLYQEYTRSGINWIPGPFIT
jgi:hypothetical protein